MTPSALAAVRQGVALYDRTAWGRIQVSDQDRLNFLHNQSTNDLKKLQPGQGCETVIVTSTARTLDLVTAYVTEDAVILLVSPNRREQLLKWLDRYIFFGDRVKLTDTTATTACFSLIGPRSLELLQTLGIQPSDNIQPHDHFLVDLDGTAVRIAVGCGLALPGYTLMTDAAAAAGLQDKLITAGAVPLEDSDWEQMRIQQGRPKPDAELTEDYNPLEAGLWHTISLNKGCYIGQETIARLNTYQGVKQQLWGIKLSQPVEPGTPITLEDSKIGILTSCSVTPEGPLGLGYVKTKAGGEGLQVQVGEIAGELIELPFLSRQPLPST